MNARLVPGPSARRALCAVLAFPAFARASAPEPSPAPLFRFDAGAPMVAAPGVGSDGSVAFGTVDGYVHHLGPEGGYRWSYTVTGRVLGAFVLGGGNVFAFTSDRKLYALDPEAKLRWIFRLPAAPAGRVVPDGAGELSFVAEDRCLYTVSEGGRLVRRVPAPDAASPPVVLTTDGLALVLGLELGVVRGFKFERRPLGADVRGATSLELAPDGSVGGLRGNTAFWSGPGRAFEAVCECAHAPLRAEGFVGLAEHGGELQLVGDDGASARVPLGRELLPPVWDAPRRRLIVAARSGAVVALDADAWLRAARAPEGGGR